MSDDERSELVSKFVMWRLNQPDMASVKATVDWRILDAVLNGPQPPCAWSEST